MSDDSVPDFFRLIEGLEAIPRIKIETAYTTVRAQPGEVIYRQGDASDSVYLVASGVVEAMTESPDRRQTRSIAYMRAGGFFGELGVLTGQPRLATIRACQEAKLLRFEKEKFLALLRTIPELGDHFSRALAQRLHATSTEAHRAVYALDLGGNLQRFDLLAIFQAITGMGHTGELKLHNSSHELVGSFFFRGGRVEQARFAHLVGLEAVWQGFLQSASEGTFHFQIVAEPTIPGDGDHVIDMDSTGLLMEGVTRRDTFQALPEPLRAMTQRLSRTAEVLDWVDPETAPVAEQVWELIAKRPQPLASLWRRLNYSALGFLQAVQALVEAGRAELLPESRTATQPLESK